MDKFKILKTYALMQKNSNLTKTTEYNNITIVFCEDNSEIWWNYALLNHIISGKELSYIENFFKKRGRKPSIYFSDDETNKPLIEYLKDRGYKTSGRDSWLFWDKEPPNIDEKDIIEVKSNSDFEKWIETFVESYPQDDPKNPYGQQTGFAEVLKKSWYHKKAENGRYYLAFKNNKPVATAILTNLNRMGYIWCVGSIPSVRGEGYGKRISLHCVNESFKAGNKYHSLATEEGHYPYEFYQKIGFNPYFVAFLYSKSPFSE